MRRTVADQQDPPGQSKVHRRSGRRATVASAAALALTTLAGIAAPALIAAAALTPLPAAAQGWVPEDETKTRRDKRAAFASDSGPALSVQVDPAFIGMTGFGTVPLVVQVKNRAAATRAHVTLTGDDMNPSAVRRTYTRDIDLPGDGAVTKFTLYAERADYSYGPFQVRVVTPRRSAADSLFINYSEPTTNIAYVGDKFGALSFRSSYAAYKRLREERRAQGYSTMPDGSRIASTQPDYVADPDDPEQPDQSGSRFVSFHPCYAKPENAPDRAVGYANLNYLVLDEGAQRMNQAQWNAIREWVSAGGSVIFTEPAYKKAFSINFGTAKSLWPDSVRSSEGYYQSDAASPRGSALWHLAAPLGGTNILTELKRGVVDLDVPNPEIGQPATALARRHFGFGTVLYVGFDPTGDAFRHSYQLPTFWQGLMKRATPLASSEVVRTTALSQTFPDTTVAGISPKEDPFHVTLPPLRPIVYLFLGYFVLAIPVTFVVLKRTRRMNLAWVTGPMLAVGVAGMLYLFTADLYRAPLSRRTAGLIVAGEGESTGRFIGQTELFFPHAGNYDVFIPAAERIELTNNDYSYGYRSSNGAAIRTLEAGDDGTQVTNPRVAVANLSFRRLYHEQPISLGKGITARLFTRPDGKLGYEINNITDLTLNSVTLTAPALVRGTTLSGNRRNAIQARILSFSTPIQPHTTIRGEEMPVTQWINPNGGTVQRIASGAVVANRAILTARVGGRDFGPAVGNWVGGEGTVEIAVPLDSDGWPQLASVFATNQTEEGGR